MSEDDTGTAATRTATVRTSHAEPALVAAALDPDNTPSMDQRVTDDGLETTIERETTGGLRSTVDDYVVNLTVADRVIDRGRAHVAGAETDSAAADADASETPEHDTNT